MKSGGSPIPLVLSALSVLVLVGVVAVASTGSTPVGSSEARRPSDMIFDTILSLGVLLLIPGAVILVYGLMQRKEIARLVASGSYRRTGVLGYLLFMLVFGLIAALGLRGLYNARFRPDDGESAGEIFPGNEVPFRPEEPGKVTTTYEPEFAWIPVLVVIGLAAIAISVYVLAGRREKRAQAGAESDVAERLADILDDTLDDLRREPDRRRAVIAAYARVERAFAASGLPRLQAETAEEYFVRILGRLEVDADPVRKLTDLFEHAKFSQHPVDDTMKNEAIEALAQIRDELRAAARRREEERVRTVAAWERAATP